MSEVDVEGASPPWTLTDRLRKAREYRGLEQRELAAVIGMAPRSIVNYERGFTRPRRPQLIAWALATGVSLAWLEGPEDSARPKGLEPLTFWSGVWEHDGPADECDDCGWPQSQCHCIQTEVDDVASITCADDLALTA